MLIETKNLSHVYMPGTPFQVKALHEVNFVVEKGAFVGIIGETGSGKSTLVQHLNGLLKPTSGEVLVDRQNIWQEGMDLRRLRSRIALLFQYPEHQLFEETVYKDVAFGPRNLGLEGTALEERVRYGMELMGLDFETCKDRSPFNLSGGEKRRAALAGILAMQPETIVLDEPTAGMDPSGRKQLLKQIRKLHREEGMTVILVTHDMEEIVRSAEKLYVFSGGRIVLQGLPSEVFSSSRYLRELGLDVPPLADLLQSLREFGLELRTDIFDEQDAAQEIIKTCKKRGR